MGYPTIIENLALERCPHCAIARPNLTRLWTKTTRDHASSTDRFWAVYLCATCGGLVLAWSHTDRVVAVEIYPSTKQVDASIPKPASTYLQQALESVHAPAGAVMLAASAVDAMLKAKNYTEGGLYSRIRQAAKDHCITSEMAAWAHEVRLDANNQRHADQEATVPTGEDARKSNEFALALGEYLFVLPARVQRGRPSEDTEGAGDATPNSTLQ